VACATTMSLPPRADTVDAAQKRSITDPITRRDGERRQEMRTILSDHRADEGVQDLDLGQADHVEARRLGRQIRERD
jgi:hypothetical protein